MKAKALACIGLILAAASSLPSRAEQASSADYRQAEAVAHGESSTNLFNRDQWELSETEWSRYESLMRGMRGSVSPATLSPIEVLGIHAQSAAERRDYAKRWAKMMRADAERILAFQAAYDEAWKELNPGGQIIDKAALYKAKAKEQWLRDGDRLLLFMRLADCPRCSAYVDLARQGLSKGAQTDIYFIGASEDSIKQWIPRQSFDEAKIKSKRLTFNLERGELATVAGPLAAAPKLIRIRDRLAVSIEP